MSRPAIKYDWRSGRERYIAHRGDLASTIAVNSGGIRFWYSEGGDLVMPPKDYFAGSLVPIEANKPFCFAALMPQTFVIQMFEGQ